MDFAVILKELVDDIYPDAEKVVLVTDNLNIHHNACLYEQFPPKEARRIAEKIEWHYTPVHGSWLNIAECELSVLRRQCLKPRMEDINIVTEKVATWESSKSKASWYRWRTNDDAGNKRREKTSQLGWRSNRN